MTGERTVLVDASVFITLSEVDCVDLLRGIRGRVEVPEAVVGEITSDPAQSELERALGDWIHSRRAVTGDRVDGVRAAAEHLGRSADPQGWAGDVALLATALAAEDCVVVTDDKPLRQTCNALSIPVSGSIGVLVRAVERGDLEAAEARAKLEAMDEVGARLSASLYRTAERLIEDVADE